ncbi:hypothetical protein NMY22_g13206 [Coprinellus aureogranulatus]|nr:hypothetical protein NMY22_g13206 [Coprinellus aureogranulatus]
MVSRLKLLPSRFLGYLKRRFRKRDTPIDTLGLFQDLDDETKAVIAEYLASLPEDEGWMFPTAGHKALQEESGDLDDAATLIGAPGFCERWDGDDRTCCSVDLSMPSAPPTEDAGAP